jgi:ribosomal protein S18 acetylase RimI-like enzyme
MRDPRPHASIEVGPDEAAALARIEEAGLNAAQPPEQLLFDGWLLRFSAGKARRARSANALAPGRIPLDEKLDGVRRAYAARGLPPLVRITPFSQPPRLDEALADRGWVAFEDTRVMTRPLAAGDGAEPDGGLRLEGVDVECFARCVGALRDSPASQIDAHLQRLRSSPLGDSTVRLVAFDGGAPIAAGQTVIEGELAGLYDIVTAPAVRGRGLGTLVSRRLLAAAAVRAARTAYLQVSADNVPARTIYQRLGFVDRYAYWYRRPADSGDEPAPREGA